MVSTHLVILVLLICTQVSKTSAEIEGGGGGDVEENSVEEEQAEEKDHDDELITKLLDTPIGNPDHDSDVARILKILEGKPCREQSQLNSKDFLYGTILMIKKLLKLFSC